MDQQKIVDDLEKVLKRLEEAADQCHKQLLTFGEAGQILKESDQQIKTILPPVSAQFKFYDREILEKTIGWSHAFSKYVSPKDCLQFEQRIVILKKIINELKPEVLRSERQPSNKEEIYQGFRLIGSSWSKVFDNDHYTVLVLPKTEQTTLEKLIFTEITYFTFETLVKLFKQNTEKAVLELARLTFAKARARITLELYEQGRDYPEELTLEDTSLKTETTDDQHVQRMLLIGLRNIRKKDPVKMGTATFL